MALIRATMGGGGGGVNETELWSNPSTTSNFGPSWTTVSLSDNMSNYDLIRICFYKSTSEQSTEYKTDLDVSNLQEASGATVRYTIGCQGEYVRDIARTSDNLDNKLRISNGYSRTTNNGTDTSKVIPTKVCGIKY